MNQFQKCIKNKKHPSIRFIRTEMCHSLQIKNQKLLLLFYAYFLSMDQYKPKENSTGNLISLKKNNFQALKFAIKLFGYGGKDLDLVDNAFHDLHISNRRVLIEKFIKINYCFIYYALKSNFNDVVVDQRVNLIKKVIFVTENPIKVTLVLRFLLQIKGRTIFISNFRMISNIQPWVE